MTDDQQILLRVPEAARRLSLSRSTVYALMARGPDNGGLPSIAIGSARRILATDLREWVERQTGCTSFDRDA